MTPWAKFSAAADLVATVDEDGQVTVQGPGEAAITVWYSNLVAASVASCRCRTRSIRRLFAEAPRTQLHRRSGAAKARSAAHPAGRAVHRPRVHPPGVPRPHRLLPTPAEVTAFLADHAARQARPARSTRCWSGRSSSITGRTSGPTCCWSRRRSCRSRRCGRSTARSARASPTTSRGTASPARSSPPRAARSTTGPPTTSCCTRTRPT